MSVKGKMKGKGLSTRTFVGESGKEYLVFRTPEGAFHVFQEIEAKGAAKDCGSTKEGNTRQAWESIWED